MKNTEKLLSVVRLKKYFPQARPHPFAPRKYLVANENITLDIHRGETFALVGESGCGKSTLGRTLLQLQRPTGGATIYYGKTLDELTPKYLFRVLKNFKKNRASYEKAVSAEVERGELPDGAATAARIFGGFLVAPEELGKRGAALLLRRYRLLARGKNSSEERKNEIVETERALETLRKECENDERFRSLEKERNNGVDLSQLTEGEMRALRKDLQIVFQDPYSSLDPRMTVGRAVEEGALVHGLYKRGSKTLKEHVAEVMKNCGLQAYTSNRYPHQFSGGQRQRVCIARALALSPEFIVCDECVSALDVSIQSQILNLLMELKEKKGLTYLFISHDLSVVRHVADRIAVMYLGKIVETGDGERVFENPRHPYTIALLSAAPSVETARGGEREKILLSGQAPDPVSPPRGCPFHTRCFMAQEICGRIPAPDVEVEKGHIVSCHFAEFSTEKKRELARKNGKTDTNGREEGKEKKN